jgi:diacylglycerol kinase family enzyme
MTDVRHPLVVVVNPRATKCSPARIRGVLAVLDRTHQVTVVHTSTNGVADLREACRSVGASAVAVMGGDGTLNHVCCSLVGHGVAVAIVPSGAGDMLARSLGIPADPFRAVEVLQVGASTPTEVRLAAVRVAGAPERVAITQVGIGWEAQLVRWADLRRHVRPAAVRLVAGALATGGRGKPRFTVRVTEPPSTTATSASVQLRYPYTRFGPLPLGVRPSPDKSPAVLVIQTGGRATTRRMGAGGVAFTAVAEEFSVHVDGELLEPAWSVTVEPAAHVMRFLVDRSRSSPWP